MADIESPLVSEIAANNTAPSPDGLPPNSSPNIVYSQGREDLASQKRAWNRLGPTVTSGGSANAQTLSYTVNPTALVRGQGYCFIAGFTNTGPMTLTVGALAATNVFQDGFALQGGEVRAGLIIEVFYDGTNYQITSGRALASLASSLGGSMRNFLINPLFNVQQRGAQNALSIPVAASSNPYTFDRWYVHVGANQASTCFMGATIFGDPHGPFGLTLQRGVGQTGVAQMFVGQAFDTDLIQLLAGQQVTVTVLVQAGVNYSGGNVTMSLSAGTGAPTRVATGFTGQTSPINIGAPVIAGGAIVTITGTGVIPAGARQLELDIAWTPTGTAGASDYLTVYAPRLNLGPVDLGADLTRIYTTELPICQRFFQKSFPATVGPGQNAGNTLGAAIYQVIIAGAAGLNLPVYLPTRMRIATPAVTLFNTNAANAQLRNVSKSTDATSTSAGNISDTGFNVSAVGIAGWAAGDFAAVHWIADAEIL